MPLGNKPLLGPTLTQFHYVIRQISFNKEEDSVDKGLIIVNGDQVCVTQMLGYDITGYKLIIQHTQQVRGIQLSID